MNSVIIGSGAWGCALAQLFLRQGFSCTIIAPNAQWAAYPSDRCSIPVPVVQEFNIVATADVVYITTPLKYLRETVIHAAPYAHSVQPWVMLSKGVEKKTLVTPYDLLQELVPVAIPLVLVGPSGASDVYAESPVGLVCATALENKNYTDTIQKDFKGVPVTVKISYDPVGVSWCAALKNCYAFGVGIIRGLSYGESAVGLLITRAIFEMRTLLLLRGGEASTVDGLAGIGDLVATAGSTWSRNVQAGIAYATGAEYSQTAEGVETLRALEPVCAAVPELVLLRFLSDCVRQQANPADIKTILVKI